MEIREQLEQVHVALKELRDRIPSTGESKTEYPVAAEANRKWSLFELFAHVEAVQLWGFLRTVFGLVIGALVLGYNFSEKI